MTDSVSCCPDCGDAGIRVVGAGSIQTTEHTPAYTCRECGARFDEPASRPALHPDRSPRNGLAAQLADPDVTEIADLESPQAQEP